VSAVIAAELRITWEQLREGRIVFEPAARYDCHRCGTTEGPVYGTAPVRSFVEHVRQVHAGRCHPTT
jgi:hypothetical protein